jgi:L-rhamnose-H+ transport protein
MNETASMTANPALGVLLFVLGGLAGAVFYLPFKKVKNWAWESYWFIYAVFALLLVPWALALVTTPNLFPALKATPITVLGACFLGGAAWGVGGLTWGLMIRYLGVGLGLALGCGLCSAAGTLIPKIIKGEFSQLFDPGAGITSFAGVVVSLVGIVLVGMAGMSKEKELPEEEKKKAVAEYNFKKGIMVAIFSGIMSSALNMGLQSGDLTQFKAQYGSATQIEKSVEAKVPDALVATPKVFFDKDSKYWIAPASPAGETTTSKTWRGMSVLVVALLGGFLVNSIWCLFLNVKNKTLGDYTKKDTPLGQNLVFAGFAGAIWCSQFIFFKTGEPAMGATAYVGWAVLMASAILFSTLLGIFLGEWKGTSGRTRGLLAAGLFLLVLTAVISGYSGKLGQEPAKNAMPVQVTAPATK